jgi:RimJ/RimL family protein N-acetyltransferase
VARIRLVPDPEGLRPALPIRTERLLLRAFSGSDLEALLSYRSRPDATRFLYWGPESEEEVREALRRKIAANTIEEEGDFLADAAEELATGSVIGDFALWWRSRRDTHGEIGFIVHPDHQGRGFATESGREMLRLDSRVSASTGSWGRPKRVIKRRRVCSASSACGRKPT